MNKESVAAAINEYNRMLSLFKSLFELLQQFLIFLDKQIPQWNTKILVTKFLPDPKRNAAKPAERPEATCETICSGIQSLMEDAQATPPKRNRGFVQEDTSFN